jgi:hypothetical protein
LAGLHNKNLPSSSGELWAERAAVVRRRTQDSYGSWLCKNAKTLNRDRRNYSSKTALVAQLASEFNLEVELKNIILVAFRFFEFLHRVKNGSRGLAAGCLLCTSKADMEFGKRGR